MFENRGQEVGQGAYQFKIQNSKFKIKKIWGIGHWGKYFFLVSLVPYTPTPLHPHTPTPLHLSGRG
ncbi:MAG: hypothetical protein ACRAVC_02620 [Trichormus sp.]